MDRLVEDLISRLEIEKAQCFRQIENLSYDENKSLENIFTGKIFAYDFCIKELQRLFEYGLKSKNSGN